jgi:hypothetical protein
MIIDEFNKCKSSCERERERERGSTARWCLKLQETTRQNKDKREIESSGAQMCDGGEENSLEEESQSNLVRGLQGRVRQLKEE